MADYSELFLQDSIDKQMTITSDNGVVITNTELHGDEFELHESLCSENQLKFGSCESSSIKFKISYVRTSLKNHWLTVKVKIGDNEPYQYGLYKVVSDVPTADREFREVEAYDALHDIIMSDVADWYNTILPNENSTVTLKQFRDNFFNHFGITQETINLPQDNMTVEKTIGPSEISGKDVVTAICEINGCFGHIGRDGKFYYIFLQEMSEGLYPRNDLFPRDDLYPSEASRNIPVVGKNYYISATYEDFFVKGINKLQIRQNENDIGAVVGTGSNCYVVEDNFLVYGKNANDLLNVANILYSQISKVSYRPCKLRIKGNPTRIVGESLKLNTKYDIIYTYILERTLKGVQALFDETNAQGEEYYNKGLNSVNKSIVQLKGKTNELTRTVEETNSRITDVQAGLQSEISQTAEQITTSVSQTYETKTDATGKLNDAKSDATNKANTAENNAKGYTDNQLTSYSTTTQMNSAISQSASSIESTVSATYETKTDATSKLNTAKDYADGVAQTAENNANDATDNKLLNYSTTTQMNSAISQSASSIESTVAATYETQSNASSEYSSLSSRITQNATSISTKVTQGTVSSEISQEAGSVSIQSNRMTIDSDNFKLSGSGEISATGSLKSINPTDSYKYSLLAGDGMQMYHDDQLAAYVTTNKWYKAGSSDTAIGLSVVTASDFVQLRTYGASTGFMVDNNNWYNYGKPVLIIGDSFFAGSYLQTQNNMKIEVGESGAKLCHTPITSGTMSYEGVSVEEALWISGPMFCTGNKNRAVETKHYGTVGMNAMESADALFSDVGSGNISEDGKCYVYFDAVFAETIEASCDYQVMLTRTSEAETKWVEKHELFFIVHGDVGATFDWMIIAKQIQYSMERTEQISYEEVNDIQFDNSVFSQDDKGAIQSSLYMNEISITDDALTDDLMTYVMDYNNIENDILTGGM